MLVSVTSKVIDKLSQGQVQPVFYDNEVVQKHNQPPQQLQYPFRIETNACSPHNKLLSNYMSSSLEM